MKFRNIARAVCLGRWISLIALSLPFAASTAADDLLYRVCCKVDDTGAGKRAVYVSPQAKAGPSLLDDWYTGKLKPQHDDYQLFHETFNYGKGQSTWTSVQRVQRKTLTLEERLIALDDAYGKAFQAQTVAELRRKLRGTSGEAAAKVIRPALLEAIQAGKLGKDVGLFVTLEQQPVLQLPRPRLRIAKDLPALGLQMELARIEAIEKRMVQMKALQQGVASDIRAAGGRVVSHGWTHNYLQVIVPREAVAKLTTHPQIKRIDSLGKMIDESCDEHYPNHEHIRRDTNIEQYVEIVTDSRDGGPFDGSRPSGMNRFGRQHIAILANSPMDITLPAFRDAAPGSALRLSGSVCAEGVGCDSDRWPANICDTRPTECDDHESQVASILLGDYMDSQDPSLSIEQRRRRTGMAPEAAGTTYWCQAASYGAHPWDEWDEAIDNAIIDGSDVINMSAAIIPYDPLCVVCEEENFWTDKVNAAFHAGSFFVKSAGNVPGKCGDCSVTNPGQAAGCFTVGAVAPGDSYDTVQLNRFSGGGPGNYGIRLTDMVTHGRSQCLLAHDGSWVQNSGTSFAAPIVAGLAADLKDHWISRGCASPSMYNDPGFLRVALLLMGDGAVSCCEHSPRGEFYEQCETAASNQAPFDSFWGAGRLKARKFNDAGMNEPWKFAVTKVDVWDGNSYDIAINANPDVCGSELSLPLPDGVSSGRFVVWWFEDNMGQGETPALIVSSLRHARRVLHHYHMPSGERHTTQRLYMDDALGYRDLTITLQGLDVTPNAERSAYRTVYVGYFWEGRSWN